MIYRVLIDIECLSILPKSGKRRDEIIDFCSDLAEITSDYDASIFQIIEPETGRTLEVSVRSGFIITWWLDAAAKRIIVVDIEKLCCSIWPFNTHHYIFQGKRIGYREREGGIVIVIRIQDKN